MSLLLSSRDLSRLTAAVEALHAPFDHPGPDAWRAEANRRVAALLGAHKAMFLLPGHAVFSDELDPDAHAAYAEYYHRFDSGAEMCHARGLAIASYVELFGRRAHYASEYYNDYLAPNGCNHTLGMTIWTGAGRPPFAFLAVQKERGSDAPFGRRVRDLMRLLLPSFEAGVRTWLRLSADREALETALDLARERIALLDEAGATLHSNLALERTLAEDPEADRLRAAIAAAAWRLVAWTRRPGTPDRLCGEDRVTTARGPYRLRAVLAGGPRVPVALVTLEPRFLVPVSAARLRELHGLSPREVEVARRMAAGDSDADVAAALGISPHTAKRHAGRVLEKLGVPSRTRVAERVLRAPGE